MSSHQQASCICICACGGATAQRTACLLILQQPYTLNLKSGPCGAGSQSHPQSQVLKALVFVARQLLHTHCQAWAWVRRQGPTLQLCLRTCTPFKGSGLDPKP